MLNSMGRPWPTADLWEYGSSWLGAWRWSDMTKWNGLTRKTTRFAIRLQHFKHHLILTAVKFINSMEMILANLRAWIRPVFPFFLQILVKTTRLNCKTSFPNDILASRATAQKPQAISGGKHAAGRANLFHKIWSFYFLGWRPTVWAQIIVFFLLLQFTDSQVAIVRTWSGWNNTQFFAKKWKCHDFFHVLIK